MGLQAAQRILGSGDPLALLAEIGQNFPGLVSSLSRQVGPRVRCVCVKDRCVRIRVGMPPGNAGSQPVAWDCAPPAPRSLVLSPLVATLPPFQGPAAPPL